MNAMPDDQLDELEAITDKALAGGRDLPSAWTAYRVATDPWHVKRLIVRPREAEAVR